MPTNYEALHKSRDPNAELTRVVRLLSDMYGDPTRFILELLQNAEDAVGNRPDGWQGERCITYRVSTDGVEVVHFGRPFNEADVRGIVIAIASTKNRRDSAGNENPNPIGTHGVGFKSVFKITDRPEIHSGDEHFAIEGIKPVGISPDPDYDQERTIFRLPFNDRDQESNAVIVDRLSDLELKTLLFLQHIDSIAWQATDGRRGRLCRETERLDENVRKVSLIQEGANGQIESCERWLVFSRPVENDGRHVGYVEIAFLLSEQDQDNESIQPLADSPLTVFFPTIVPTELGFLIQGPYRTIPNRENAPPADDWNQKLMAETAMLIPDVMQWLKDHRLLDAQTLDRFPIHGFHEEHERYGPLFAATKAALESRALLPCTDGSYQRATETRLGSTDAMRRLISPQQLAELYGQSGNLFWVDGRITDVRFQGLRRYIRDELGVDDVTPGRLIPLLRSGRAFLETQSDEWICQLYVFLGQQTDLHDRLGDVPILRLEDGRHVAPERELSVFLPGKVAHGSSIIRKDVCGTAAALVFLKALGLRERDLVDEVIEGILPKYDTESPDAAGYDEDMRLIVEAYANVTASRKDEFVEQLSGVRFVKTIDACDGTNRYSQPSEVFLADDEQKKLFSGVPGVQFLDDAHECLRNPSIHDLLIECDAVQSSDMDRVVIGHVLPKYSGGVISIDAVTYTRDIQRIVTAYQATPNERLLSFRNRLNGARFVKVIDTGSGEQSWGTPGSMYLATEQLRELFAGVKGVLLVDFNQSSLRGKSATNLLAACGASSVLRKLPQNTEFTWIEKLEMREKAGCVDVSYSGRVQDHTLSGLDALLRVLPDLDVKERLGKSKLLWEALCELEAVEGSAAFSGEYRWFYYHSRSARFDADFVRKLNDTAWVPDADGELRQPRSVRFDMLGWPTNEIVETKIRFQPPVVQELAREAGIDEEVLDWAQNATPDDLSEFKEWRESRKRNEPDSQSSGGNDFAPTPPVQTDKQDGSNGSYTTYKGGGTGVGSNANGNGGETGSGNHTSSGGGFSSTGNGSGNHSSGSGGTRQFYSYVGVHHADETDTNSPEHAARMALEETAIRFILEQEPAWQRTDTNNPGFDLYQVDANGITIRWCEVKAMSGAFDSHPVGMSKRQFEEAQLRGEAYWLYVVEDAATDAPRIVPIQDPAGQARTFTFDKGWRDVAAEQDTNESIRSHT